MVRECGGKSPHTGSKQKIRRTYGVLETQFHNYFEKADAKVGITGENLVQFLECRLDNLVYRLGFGASRKQARQLVRHRHIMVDGKLVDIPSYQVRPNQVIKVKDKSKNLDQVHMSLKLGHGEEFPWLRLNKAALEGELLALPKRSEIPLTANEQLVVELYSK
jgi:small subunit ribosomal protein S4